ncbi:MAG: acyl-CoA dehydrogenase family protein [Burkholderiales bacterium]
MPDPHTEPAAAEHRRILADSVADFAARGTDLARVRRLRGMSAEYDRAVWKSMAERGWLGILIPERYGGSREIQRNILAKYVLKLPD